MSNFENRQPFDDLATSAKPFGTARVGLHRGAARCDLETRSPRRGRMRTLDEDSPLFEEITPDQRSNIPCRDDGDFQITGAVDTGYRIITSTTG